MLAARVHSIAGSLAYDFMDWRHMTEILSAGQEVYTELLNLCVWAKSNGGMGSFYRSVQMRLAKSFCQSTLLVDRVQSEPLSGQFPLTGNKTEKYSIFFA
jgi:hypothetical protein